jgi:hypothetical protein
VVLLLVAVDEEVSELLDPGPPHPTTASDPARAKALRSAPRQRVRT